MLLSWTLSSNALLQRGFLSLSSCWLGLVLHVLCAEFASGFVSLWAETPHSSQNMGFQLGFPCLCSHPLLCLPQASICRADVSQVGASPLDLRPPQLIFLSGRFSRNHGTLAGFGVQARFLGGCAPPYSHCQACCLQLCAGALLCTSLRDLALGQRFRGSEGTATRASLLG